MPTTFANTINGNEILAKRSQCDYAGNDLQTTYATKSEVTTGLSSKEDSANKAQSINTSSTTDYPSSKATADFVNSSVATNTAKFLGNFTLSDLSLTYPATDAQIETALDGYAFSPAPTNNDYVYVEIQDPQTPGVTDVVKRFKYDGANWLYEYSLNNSSFTAQEIAAIDSGITSTKVGNYDNHLADTTIHVTSTDKSTWDAKQDAISDLATIRSGAQAGATAVQPSDLATVATSGLYSDLSGTPTIPPALSAGNGIDITNDTVSVDLDGTSLTNGANGLSVTLPVPDTTGASQGDVLSVGQSGIEWVTPGGGGGDDAVLTYNVSTWSDFTTAYNAGKNIRVAETVDGTTYEAVLFEYNPNGSPHGYAKFTATILGTGVGAVSSNWYQISNIGSGVWTRGAGTVQGNFSGQGAISVNSSSHMISLTLDGSSLTQSSSGLAVANPLPSTLGTAGQVLQVNSGATSVEWATPSGGSVTDVEVDGVSVVSQGVASITMPTVDQTYNSASTNAQSGVAVAGAIAGVNQVPSSTSADEGKILKVDANGDPEWATGGGGTQADWSESDPSDPSYIENKPVPKTLLAGNGITITETANNLTVAATAASYTAGTGISISAQNVITNTGVAINKTTPELCGSFMGEPVYTKLYEFTGTVGTSDTTVNFTIDEVVATGSTVTRIWLDPSNSFIEYGSASVKLPLTYFLSSDRHGSVFVVSQSAGTLSFRGVDTSSVGLTFFLAVKYTDPTP